MAAAGWPAAQHNYTAAGVYQVVVTATNSLGSQQTSAIITVTEALTVDPGSSHTTSDGALTFSIPAAISGTVTFTYTPQTDTASTPGGYEFGGLAFTLRAVDGGGNPIIEPSEAFTLTIHYDENALPPGTDETTLELRRYDETLDVWLALTVLDRDPSNDTITLRLDHFSEFALWVESAQTEQKIYLPLVLR